MAAPIKGTKLSEVHAEACKVALEMLKGEYLTDKQGNLVMIDGQPLRQTCSPAAFDKVLTMLRDHGIDEEPTEDSNIMNVAKAIRKFDDAHDPFLIPDKKSSKESTL